MGQNSSQTIRDSFTLAATSTTTVDIDTTNSHDLKLLVITTYQATNNPTGVTVKLYGGFGPPNTASSGPVPIVIDGDFDDPVPIFSDNSTTVTMDDPDAATGTEQINKTYFYLDELNMRWPRWVRVEITNKDTANSVEIKILGDV